MQRPGHCQAEGGNGGIEAVLVKDREPAVEFESASFRPLLRRAPAAAALPRRLKQAKRRAVGVRLPDHPVAQALIAEVREPLLSTTLALPGDDDLSNHEADEVAERMMRHVGFMLDAGDTEPGPTSVIDLSGDEPVVVREGVGPIDL